MDGNDDFDYREFLDKIYLSYSKQLLEIALIRLGNEEDAKDALGETFYIATLKVDEVFNHPNKIAWLCRVLDFCIKRILYRNVMRLKKNEVCVKSDSSFDDKYKKIDFVSIDSPNHEINSREFSYNEKYYEESIFDEFKDILTEKEMMYIIYKFEYDYDNITISDKLGISYSATTSLGNRAKNKLKKLYPGRDKT